MQYDVVFYGEKALLINFKNEISPEVHQHVKICYFYLKSLKLNGIEALIPAYNSLTVVFNIDKIERKTLKVLLENIPFEKETKIATSSKTVKIPVCYDVSLGIDLKEVSLKLNLSISKIIELHASKPYLVYMLGFAPGFMYLGGLDKRLHIPRKKTPRLKIHAGAVGLADQQTGVYPLETPGGWQIIGQTPLSLFNPKQPSLVEMGNFVQFVPITLREFHQIQQKCK